MALLSYIALEGRTTRAALATLLWPEKDERSAAGNLRTILYAIRSAVGEPVLLYDHEVVGMADRTEWEIDIDFLESISKRLARKVNIPVSELEGSIARYGGPFMKGFGLSDSQAFDDWQTFRADHYRSIYRHLLSETISRYSDAGRFDDAIASARRIVALDELEEESYRVLMLLNARSGKKRDAIKVYERCKRILESELNQVPDRKTVELLRRIESNELEDGSRNLEGDGKAGGGSGGGRRSLPVSSTTVFIGRERELTRMKQSLSDVFSGGGCVEMIGGEPGIGKTWLARQFEEEAIGMQATVLRGSGYKDRGVPPLWPWIQVMREYLRTNGRERMMSEWGEGAQYAGMLVPEILAAETEPAMQAGSSKMTSSPQTERFLFYNAVCEFFHAASARNPLVIILDDLQWADAASLSLVCALSREIGISRVYLLGLYREREFALSHAFSVMLGKLSKLARYRCHLLSGFSVTETAEYAAALDRDYSGSAENGRSLHTLTHGNPLFIRHLAPIAGETLSTGIHSREAFRLPPGLREAIGMTLEELSDSCVEVLKTASLLGLEFVSSQLLYTMDSGCRDVLMKSLDEAAAYHVIERNEKTDGFRFSHELVRDALRSAIDGSTRAELHAKIGTMLEALYAQDIETHAAEILHHYVRATGMIEPGRIARIALLAGKRAAALFEYDGALEYLDAGLESVGDADMDETKAWLLLFHGVVPRSDEVERKCLAEADIEDILAALRYFEQDSDANMEEAIDGTLFSLSGTWDAFIWIKRQMLRTDGIRSEKWRGRISADLARHMMVFENDEAKMREYMEYSLRMAEKTHDPLVDINVAVMLAAYDIQRSDYDNALLHSRRAKALCAESGLSSMLFVSVLTELSILTFQGKFKERECIFRERQSMKTSYPTAFRIRIELEQAYFELQRANIGETRRILSELERWKHTFMPLMWDLNILTECNAGDCERGMRWLEELLCMTNGDYCPMSYIGSTLEAVRYFWNESLFSPVVMTARRLIADPKTAQNLRSVSAAFLALISAYRNEIAAGREYYDTLSSETFPYGSLILGWIAVKLGRVEEALDHLDGSRFDPFYQKFDYIWSRCYRGEALLGRNREGDASEAVRDLTEAAALAGACGMVFAEKYALDILGAVAERERSNDRSITIPESGSSARGKSSVIEGDSGSSHIPRSMGATPGTRRRSLPRNHRYPLR